MNPVHAGDQIDHYKIEQLVARSGMASIYRATDTRTGRPVAIKIPHPEMECDPIFFERFHRESDIGARLDHPGVMKVFVNEDHQRVYMVMEWVEGRLLRRAMGEQRKFPPERAVKITLRILDALGYIHNHGVVHRDLKPENIMLDADDNIKLIDFGIAANAGALAHHLCQAQQHHGHARLYFSGTGQRKTGRRAQRPLRFGRDAL